MHCSRHFKSEFRICFDPGQPSPAGIVLSGQPPRHHVVRQPLPVGVGIREPLLTRREVFGILPRETAVVLSNRRPLLERVDVRD